MKDASAWGKGPLLRMTIRDPYWGMESIIVHLHKSADAEDGYALSVDGDGSDSWRAEQGYGRKFQKVWTVELQSRTRPELSQVDWIAVMSRMIEAFDMNDPIIAGFEWPLRENP